jgi:hypothetical protein
MSEFVPNIKVVLTVLPPGLSILATAEMAPVFGVEVEVVVV